MLAHITPTNHFHMKIRVTGQRHPRSNELEMDIITPSSGGTMTPSSYYYPPLPPARVQSKRLSATYASQSTTCMAGMNDEFEGLELGEGSITRLEMGQDPPRPYGGARKKHLQTEKKLKRHRRVGSALSAVPFGTPTIGEEEENNAFGELESILASVEKEERRGGEGGSGEMVDPYFNVSVSSLRNGMSSPFSAGMTPVSTGSSVKL